VKDKRLTHSSLRASLYLSFRIFNHSWTSYSWILFSSFELLDLQNASKIDLVVDIKFRKSSSWTLLAIHEIMNADDSNFELASLNLLEKIDRLFACNVEEYVDLSQLIVVDDQSSDKSSVLEALTNLSFPRESWLCTRFVTQIIFRRFQETQVSILVISTKIAIEEHKVVCRT